MVTFYYIKTIPGYLFSMVLVRDRDTNYEAISTFDGKACNVLADRCHIWNNLSGKEHCPGSCLSLKKTSWLPRKFPIKCHYLVLFFDKSPQGKSWPLSFQVWIFIYQVVHQLWVDLY